MYFYMEFLVCAYIYIISSQTTQDPISLSHEYPNYYFNTPSNICPHPLVCLGHR